MNNIFRIFHGKTLLLFRLHVYKIKGHPEINSLALVQLKENVLEDIRHASKNLQREIQYMSIY